MADIDLSAMALIVVLLAAILVAAISGASVMTVRAFRINNQIKQYIDSAGSLTGMMRVWPFGVLIVSVFDPWRYLPSEAAGLVSAQRRNCLFWIIICGIGAAAGAALDFLTYSP